MAQLTKKIAYSGSNPEYIGEARPGTATSTAAWRIKKLVYSGTNPIDECWADGTDAFDKIWDNYNLYSYRA